KEVSILFLVAVKIFPLGTLILGKLTSPETVSLCIGLRIAQLSPLVCETNSFTTFPFFSTNFSYLFVVLLITRRFCLKLTTIFSNSSFVSFVKLSQGFLNWVNLSRSFPSLSIHFSLFRNLFCKSYLEFSDFAD